jgi:hypothetical protein
VLVSRLAGFIAADLVDRSARRVGPEDSAAALARRQRRETAASLTRSGFARLRVRGRSHSGTMAVRVAHCVWAFSRLHPKHGTTGSKWRYGSD